MRVDRFTVVPAGYSFVARDGNTGENVWESMGPRQEDVVRWVAERNERWEIFLRSIGAKSRVVVFGVDAGPEPSSCVGVEYECLTDGSSRPTAFFDFSGLVP